MDGGILSIIGFVAPFLLALYFLQQIANDGFKKWDTVFLFVVSMTLLYARLKPVLEKELNLNIRSADYETLYTDELE